MPTIKNVHYSFMKIYFIFFCIILTGCNENHHELNKNNTQNIIIKNEWKIDKSVSPMDDSETITMILPAVHSIAAWPDVISKPELNLRYQENKFEIYINLGVIPRVEAGQRRTVTIRFDDQPARDYEGVLSTDNMALFFESKPLLKKIYKSKTMTFRFTPINSNPVTTKFDLTGFKEKSGDLLSAIGIDFERINIFEDKMSDILELVSLPDKYGIELKNNMLSIQVEARSWKEFWRVEGATERIFKSLNHLSQIPENIDCRYDINLVGSNHNMPLSRESGKPFKSEELKEIFENALTKSRLNRDLIGEIKVQDHPPTLYGKDTKYSNLVGTIKSTNEKVEIYAYCKSN